MQVAADSGSGSELKSFPGVLPLFWRHCDPDDQIYYCLQFDQVELRDRSTCSDGLSTEAPRPPEDGGAVKTKAPLLLACLPKATIAFKSRSVSHLGGWHFKLARLVTKRT